MTKRGAQIRIVEQRVTKRCVEKELRWVPTSKRGYYKQELVCVRYEEKHSAKKREEKKLEAITSEELTQRRARRREELEESRKLREAELRLIHKKRVEELRETEKNKPKSKRSRKKKK